MQYLPNLLSAARLVSVIPLLAFAWAERPLPFLLLLLLAIVSDAVDGWVARRFNAQTALGVRLDSLADYAIYIAVPLGGWWLWPEIVVRELFWFALVVLGYLLPGAVALLRFNRLAAYHTWSAKAAVVVLAIAVMVLFAGGPAWPLHLGAPLALLAGLEQTAITLVVDRARDELPTIVHAWRGRGAEKG